MNGIKESEEKVNIKSYNVKTEDGGIYRRNRRHLRSSKEQFELNDPNLEMKDNDRQDDSCVRSNETSCETLNFRWYRSSQDDLVELEKSQVT